MKKYLLFTPFLALALTMSCSSKVDNSVFAINDNKIEIFFDAEEGVYKDGLHVHSIRILSGYTWKDIKTIAPTSSDIDYGDSTLKGWLHDGGREIKDSDVFTDKYTVLKADYNMLKKINITISAGEGHWTDETQGDKQLTAIEGDTWGKYYDSYSVIADDVLTNEFKFWSTDGTNPINEDYILQAGDTIIAIYGPIGTTTNFETDSWPVFINALNEGFNFISKTVEGAHGGYSTAFNESIEGKKDPDTFVGLERTLTIYNTNYKVRVIDENIDPIHGGSGVNATLTFQFVDAIENAVGWDITGNSVYESSSIRSYLNGQFTDALPDDVVDGIVEVDKPTYKGGAAYLSVETYSEKVFLPSIRELGITSFKVDPQTVVEPQLEGTTYKYYWHDSELPPEYAKIKKMYNGIECNYWLRSPDDQANGGAWWIDRNGNVAEEQGIIPGSVRYGFAIAPCFAMGSTL